MILTNAQVATMTPGTDLINHGCVVLDGARIAWVGPQSALPAAHAARSLVDLGGRLITPALIDCHTHLVFAGDRAREFEQRLNGASYAEIARAGGGILATVSATRAASQDELLAQALPRVDQMLAEGVSTIEIKIGRASCRERV